MRLREFEELAGGEEIPVLPATEEQLPSRFVMFPAGSAGLTPTEPPLRRLRLPRFSAFRFPALKLQGFRTYALDGELFNDFSLIDAARANHQFDQKARIGFRENLSIGEDGELLPRSDPEEVVPYRGCVLLSSDEPVNFGSWLARVLPKALLFRRVQGIERVMVFAALPWMPGFLRTFLPNVDIVNHDPRKRYALSEPVIPSLASPDFYFRREVREALAPFIERAQAAYPDTPERIYLSRRKMAILRPGQRVLENETDLVERLIEHGYEEFFPEDRPLEEQIATVSRARLIVSAGGSNLFNCYFARNAELIVDLEASRRFVAGHFNVLASTGAPFSIVEGTPTEGPHRRQQNWRIDVGCLLDGLTKLGAL